MRSLLRQNTGTVTIVMASLLSLFSAPQQVTAVDIVDDPIQIDERVTQLIQTSNSLCWEIYRYHQQQPDYADTYRAAKQFWTQASQTQEALRSGPVETETLQQRTNELNQALALVEKNIAKWQSGDRTSVPMTIGPTQREVIAPGTSVDLPLLGIHIGGPNVVVTEDGVPLLQRIWLHPNSRGSKRSLERELAAVKVALSYLAEDAGLPVDTAPQRLAASATKPTSLPPVPGFTEQSEPEVVQPRKAPTPAPSANPK